MNNTNQQNTNQNEVEMKYALERQKFEIEYKKKLSELEKENPKDQEVRDKVHQWYADSLKQLQVRELGETKIEDGKDLLEKIGDKITETVKPAVDFIKDYLPDGNSTEEKDWNKQTKDVNYIENVKKETDLNNVKNEIKNQ